ncbi:MAG: MOSC N-terminal beta barrel domain-containing protein, partial [Actinomycetota bacterium]|nr:MOSC N-terminal beta barrel domain-containing protein [Actinomycetota bacterium]
MQITQLWRYPVKSMIGETVDAVEVDPLGVVGDRTWAARDLERGGIRGAKKIAALMELSATGLAEGHAEITLPDGSSVTTIDDDVD